MAKFKICKFIEDEDEAIIINAPNIEKAVKQFERDLNKPLTYEISSEHMGYIRYLGNKTKYCDFTIHSIIG